MDREPTLIRRPFVDKLPEDFPRPDVNPYVSSHRTFGDEIVPASDAPGLRGRWHEAFGRTAPLHLEVGSGNGFYLAGMAARWPDRDWIGVELRFKRVVLAARKLRSANQTNARVVRYDATLLDELFLPGSLAGIHVNHPDPWAHRAQAKHRLIERPFVELCARLLAPGAELRLKTDFHPHVDALVRCATGLPLVVERVVADVAVEGPPWADDVRTNYQRKADERGAPVAAAILRRS